MTTPKPPSQPGCKWVEECIESCVATSVYVEEQGVGATFQNPRGKQIRKIHYDGCYNKTPSELKADYIVGLPGIVDVIVELKGSDLKHASDQVGSTLQAWRLDPNPCSQRLRALSYLDVLKAKGRWAGRTPRMNSMRESVERAFLRDTKRCFGFAKAAQNSSNSMTSFGKPMPASLQDQLDEITANTRHLVQPERLAVGERAVAELFASGIEEKILPVGAIAPEFALKDATRQASSAPPTCSPSARWSSNSSAAAGAPIASPSSKPGAISTAQLRERGALMVAISPQTERQSDFMAGQHGLPFPVLTDPGNASPNSSAWSTPSPNTTATTTSPSSSTSPSSMASKLASSLARHLCHRPRGARRLRRGPRRLPRPPRAGRSSLRRPRPPRPVPKPPDSIRRLLPPHSTPRPLPIPKPSQSLHPSLCPPHQRS